MYLSQAAADVGANSGFPFTVAQAANRMGVSLSDISIRNGVAYVEIGFAQTL